MTHSQKLAGVMMMQWLAIHQGRCSRQLLHTWKCNKSGSELHLIKLDSQALSPIHNSFFLQAWNLIWSLIWLKHDLKFDFHVWLTGLLLDLKFDSKVDLSSFEDSVLKLQALTCSS